jgi:hypothetical protein
MQDHEELNALFVSNAMGELSKNTRLVFEKAEKLQGSLIEKNGR